MEIIEIINEYNKNIRTRTAEETWDIYLDRVSEYKKEHPYSGVDLVFMYPDVIGWDEKWLENMRKQTPHSNMLNKLKEIWDTK